MKPEGAAQRERNNMDKLVSGRTSQSRVCQRGIVSDDILIDGLVQLARKHPAEQWVEHRRQREEEDRRQRVTVITEFDAGDPKATMHALADEILKYRRALRLLATAVGWVSTSAPFGLIAPGPLWCPRRTSEGDGVPPAA
jgi:hypothetical protein